MLTFKATVSIALVALAGACSRGTEARSDDGLSNDLALAAQAQSYQPQQFVSPGEQQPGTAGAAPQYQAYRSPPPAYRAPAVYRAPARRTASRTASRAPSRDVYYPSEPAPARETIRHTKRDAAIGAAAGAIIGAATSRDKVKGGLIGAAAGGILGGIIGHTVDVKRP